MKKVTLGCITYTYKKDGTVTRTVDETKRAAMLAKLALDETK
tara:strand:- start:1332 stop:1457 length:126 start_codon:yes stop_codon:yes gene_type:complete